MSVTIPKMKASQLLKLQYYLETGHLLSEWYTEDDEIFNYIEWLEAKIELQLNQKRQGELAYANAKNCERLSTTGK